MGWRAGDTRRYFNIARGYFNHRARDLSVVSAPNYGVHPRSNERRRSGVPMRGSHTSQATDSAAVPFALYGNYRVSIETIGATRRPANRISESLVSRPPSAPNRASEISRPRNPENSENVSSFIEMIARRFAARNHAPFPVPPVPLPLSPSSPLPEGNHPGII